MVRDLLMTSRRLHLMSLLLALLGSSRVGVAADTPTNTVSVLLTNGVVEVSRSTPPNWSRASTVAPASVLFPGQQLRTGERSRAAVQLADRTIKQMGPSSLLTVLEPRSSTARVGLLQGLFHFFHRDEPGSVEADTPSVSLVIRGTEFHVEVQPDGTTLVQLFDGTVQLRNAAGELEIQGREGAIVRPGQRPERAPALFATRVIQWALYYPAILPPEELLLNEEARGALGVSLQAYAQGDLIQAIAAYPLNRTPLTNPERLYLASLLLSVGEVQRATEELAALSAPTSHEQRIERALRSLIATVQGDEAGQLTNATADPILAVEWLAASYRLQSHPPSGRKPQTDSLLAAQRAAQRATEVRPEFGFAWIRWAELEFSFGQRAAAWTKLGHGTKLSPKNAHAAALRGFLRAAENRSRDALQEFQHAIDLEPHLAFAWLGRGLNRIRLGDREEGILDLETAAALEPQRSTLRSYLGKALADAGNLPKAEHELELARSFDPHDPTPWLYQALLDEQENRVNRSVENLEKAVGLNQNRALYRSQLLLDQDRAVQGANLARLYTDVGMTEVALWEASRAAQTDYATPGARLFLAETFDALRDPRQIQLRYETPWLNEYLLANLLSPVGAGPLSPFVSAQEFSKLFEQDRLGILSRTEYLSRGDWRQIGVQYGTFGRTAYAVEADALWEQGQWTNGDREALTLKARLKQEFSPSDRLYLEITRYNEDSGDLSQHRSPDQVIQGLEFRERQDPTVVAGWTHEWDATSHTLLLASYLGDRYDLRNPAHSTGVTLRDVNSGAVVDVQPVFLNQSYSSRLEGWSGEAQQIKQAGGATWVVGGRAQTGSFHTSSEEQDLLGQVLFFPPAISEAVTTSLQRFTGYGWAYWQPLPTLVGIGGVSWDHLRYPINHRYAPTSTEEASRSSISPKLGWVWSPTRRTTLRGAVWRNSGGVSLEQSYQLEPTQTAGFVHAYRSLIPESVAGSSAAAKHEGASLAWDQRHPTGTYFGVQGDWITSQVTRERGVFEFDTLAFAILPDALREHLDFVERTLSGYVHQRVGDHVTLGTTYRISRAELEDVFPGVANPTPSGFVANSQDRATLQTLRLLTRFRHPTGFFSGIEAVWYDQSMPRVEHEDLWQWNLEVGWRFARRSVELRLALLNVTDQDYRLHPLNSLNELPRERTLAMGLRWQF